MRARLRPALLSLLVIAGAFALGGCEEEELDSGRLIIDDDRLSGTTVTVFLTLGDDAPLSATVAVGQTTELTVVIGTYTVTFDDDGTPGKSSGDTVQTGVVVQKDLTTTVEYAGPDDTGVIGPNLHANG